MPILIYTSKLRTDFLSFFGAVCTSKVQRLVGLSFFFLHKTPSDFYLALPLTPCPNASEGNMVLWACVMVLLFVTWVVVGGVSSTRSDDLT